MRILFLHQNAPGQFRHLAPFLARHESNDIVFLGEQQHGFPLVPGHDRVRCLRYASPKPAATGTHHYLHRMEGSVRRAQSVARACLTLRERGWEPDIIVGHPGWGETLFVREALPRAAILSYCEMFYRSEGQDTGYIPETALDLDGRCRLRTWNAELLAALELMDRGLAPTEWQRVQHPGIFQPLITVVHEGVDLTEAAPNPGARFALPDGRVLTTGDEVVTFVARNLEPVRGFVSLMRALPDLLRRRPAAQIVICGGDDVSYGRRPAGATTWRETMLLECPVDPARVHFVGRLARPDYLALLQVSSLHLYLTVPFVLSWSCVEALAAGCLVLGADVAPVREVLRDGVNGFLVDGRDPQAIATQAADLLARRASLAAVRQRARQTCAEMFDIRRCLEAQARLVREMVS